MRALKEKRIAVFGSSVFGTRIAYEAENGVLSRALNSRIADRNWAPSSDRSVSSLIAICSDCENPFNTIMSGILEQSDVIVEDLLRLTAGEWKVIADAAKEAGLLIMVHQPFLFDPTVVKLRQIVSDRLLGDLRYGFCEQFGTVATSIVPVEYVSLLVSIFKTNPLEVTCTAGLFASPRLPAISVSSFRFNGEQLVHVFMSSLTPGCEERLLISGTNCAVGISGRGEGRQLRIYQPPGESRSGLPAVPEGLTLNVSLDDPVNLELQHFAECMIERREPETGADGATSIVQIIDACQISLQLRGRPTSLDGVR